MSNFFIDHPVFAWVVAIIITLAGVLSIVSLGIESYPNIAPPQIVISAVYPGASASTAESTVTQVIEQQLTGIDHLLYFSSSTSSSGRVQITLTFDTGTNPDIAQVQVQNKVSLATSHLPTEVTQQGAVVVAKANAGFLEVVALQSNNPGIDQPRLNDIVASQVLDQISRVPGVGSTQQFGAEYAMRIWLNPDKLHGYGLSATQVLNAVQAQNVQFAAGSLGADPMTNGWGFTESVSAEGRFSSPDQFRNIILRANSDGTAVTLGDVATVGFGPQSYGFDTEYNGKPIAAFAIQLLPGANALSVATAVRTEMDDLAVSFPQGVSWFTPYDSTTFVTISIKEVMETLFEAIVLVFLVMLLFLQNIRATIIPTIVIPIALLGAFLALKFIGYTINQMTLFGMVLAIGIVVDDAIMVVENVERLMTEEHLGPRDAARKSMSQLSGAIVAITVVLIAVFVPSAMQGGASGIIYRQFAVTIVLAMAFSAFLALTFTPSLCASMLRPESERKKKNILFRKFNDVFGWTTRTYVGHIGSAVRHAPRWMAVYVAVAVLAVFLYSRVPGSFLPEEDQGYAMAIVQLPPGATKERTEGVMKEMRDILLKDKAVEGVMQVVGFSFQGSGENTGMAFIKLTDWSQRDITAMQFIQRANGQMRQIHDGQIFIVNVPTVSGLGQFGGFDMFLENRSGSGRQELTAATGTLLAKAAQDPVLSGVHPNALPDAPQLDLTVDRRQAASMGLSVGDIYNAIQLMLAPVYVNDFTYAGRVKQVWMQAAAPFRQSPAAMQDFFTPSSTETNPDGTPAMIPISNVVHQQQVMASPSLARYNGYPAMEIVGSPAPGRASGDAMNEMAKLIKQNVPHGFGFDWTGQSYQEVLSGNAGTMLMLMSLVIVFLALSALYESWSIPVAVLLIVPLTLLGVVVFTLGRGLANDIYFKIGLLTVIGLAAKNAILIVEYAIDAQKKEGKTLFEGVLEAAHLRFRPILMTSLAFILGVFPLFISTGAGANSRHAIGTGVIGGMLFATFFGLLLIPVFYVTVRRLHGEKLDETAPAQPQNTPPDAPR